MKKIRFGTFETNSSSTHSLVVMSKEDWKKVEAGELYIDVYAAEKGETKLVKEDVLIKEARKEYNEEYDDIHHRTFDEVLSTLSEGARLSHDINIFGFAGERFINPDSGVWHDHAVIPVDEDNVEISFEHFFG